MSGFFLLADGTENVSNAIDFSALTNQLTSVINPTVVLTIMGTIVGATATIFLARWGGTKIIGAIQSVLKRGKIRA